jgi:alkylation response protein AidB-like acyl-CoA dehydrogenase
MDFDFTQEQLLLQDSVRKFLEKNYDFDTRREIVAARQGFGPMAWQGLASLGLLGVNVPESHGGFGGGGVETMIVMEAFGRHLVVEPWVASAVMGTSCIGRYDLSRVATTARLEGGFWHISGSKAVVVHGAVADLLIVSARTAGQPGDAEGISLFFVNPGEEGVEGREFPLYDGTRAVEASFHDVRVSSDSLIGVQDQGLPLVELVVDRAIAALCAEAVGCMQALMERTTEYLKTRQQFGVPIGRFQALQHRMVDMLVHTEQARSMAMLAALRVESPDAAQRRKAVSAAKELIGRAGRFVGQQAVQLHGGMGMTEELDVGHYVKRLQAIDTQFGDADWHLDRFVAAEAAAPLPDFSRPRSKWKKL